MSRVCQQSPCLSHVSCSITSLFPIRSDNSCGNTFSFNPSWPTSWWTWPLPPDDHPIPPSPPDKAGSSEGTFTSHSLQLIPGLWLYLNVIWGRKKQRERCWQLWCVLRGIHRCYHSLSYARTGRWKPLPGTVLGLSLLMHRLNTHSTARWYTHTQREREPRRSCPEDFLITVSEWEAAGHTEGRPPGLSHTPPCLPGLLWNTLFLAFIYDFFSSEGTRCTGGKVRRRFV